MPSNTCFSACLVSWKFDERCSDRERLLTRSLFGVGSAIRRATRAWTAANDRDDDGQHWRSSSAAGNGQNATKGPQWDPSFSASLLERETGFEPATSTLARSHSTTELFPRGFRIPGANRRDRRETCPGGVFSRGVRACQATLPQRCISSSCRRDGWLSDRTSRSRSRSSSCCLFAA